MHIYIHIPFCHSKCPYCAFGSRSDKFGLVREYFKALKAEILGSNLSEISTIFIGGGTPSAVGAKFYAEIFKILRPKFGRNIEISVEANPNSASFEWLSKMRSYGVNRVSFGGQSFDEKKLKFLGRNHSVKDIKNAVLNAKKAGLENLSVDIIYSTKFDTKKVLLSEVENLKSLEISHASFYSLTLEENTPFENNFKGVKDSPVLAKFLFKNLENAGFRQYEISNFGRVCKHNLSYWKLEDYAGFGAFSVGFEKFKSDENLSERNLNDKNFGSEILNDKNLKSQSGGMRIYAPKSIEEYIKNPFLKRYEFLTQNDIKIEKIFLGLRSVLGVGAEILSKSELKRAEILAKERKLLFKNSKFYNPNFLLADELTLFITGD